jgi:hypothetical protein
MNGTANQPNLLELAKQGNAQAIATLINRQLQPKGITAKAAAKDTCLQVMLESVQVPNQQAFVEFIYEGITSLGAESIKSVKIYGRQAGEEFPAWSQKLDLESPPSLVLSTLSPSLSSASPRGEENQNNSQIEEPIFNQKALSISSKFIKNLTVKQVAIIGLIGIGICILIDFQIERNESRELACQYSAAIGKTPEYCK